MSKKLNGFQLRQQKHQTQHNQILNQYNDKLIYGTHLDGVRPTNTDSIIYRTSYNNLPKTLTPKIRKILNDYTFYSKSCYYNSLILSLLFDGVDLVKGYYGRKVKNLDYNNMGDVYGNIKVINEDKDFVMIGRKNHKNHKDVRFYNKKNEIMYSRHSWNKYDGKYFDITTEIEDYEEGKDWLYLIGMECRDMSSLRKSKDVVKTFVKKTFDRMNEMVETYKVHTGSYGHYRLKDIYGLV